MLYSRSYEAPGGSMPGALTVATCIKFLKSQPGFCFLGMSLLAGNQILIFCLNGKHCSVQVAATCLWTYFDTVQAAFNVAIVLNSCRRRPA